jgi:hypothetical protein
MEVRWFCRLMFWRLGLILPYDEMIAFIYARVTAWKCVEPAKLPVYKFASKPMRPPSAFRALYYTLPVTVVFPSLLGRTEHLFTQTPKKIHEVAGCYHDSRPAKHNGSVARTALSWEVSRRF